MKIAQKNLSLNKPSVIRILLLTGFLFFYKSQYTKAQINLVPNASFENLTTCNYSWDSITMAKPWNNLFPIGGADILSENNCSINGTAGPLAPYNIFNYQIARTGNNYLDEGTFLTLGSGFNIKEYANCPLNSTLQSGHSYCVTFYIVIGNYTKYATDDISLYLDDGSITQPFQWSLINATPQINSIPGLILKDTLNWIKIQGNYVANGTENHITLGSFKNDSFVNYIALDTLHPSGIANYFIDDVSVIESGTKIHVNDTIINKGDTISLGKSIEGMPVDWYDLQGNLLAASSTINISPTTTTSYVVKMDLCGNVSYDTVTVSVSTGVEQLVNDNEKLVVYPNPASQSIVISHQSPESNREVNTIEITDVLGRILMVRQAHHDGITIVGHADEGSISINVETLPSGVYFIKATDKNGNVKIGKFVKD